MDSDTEFRFLSADNKSRNGRFIFNIRRKTDSRVIFEKEIAISNLSYTYPEGKRVLKEFDCTIRKGEYIGIRGSSGIGKSTLFNLLLGFLKPDGGEIRIDGVLLSAENRKLWHRRIGYVPQGVFYS